MGEGIVWNSGADSKGHPAHLPAKRGHHRITFALAVEV